MYYNVSQLLKEPVGSTRTYPIAGSFAIEESGAHLDSQGEVCLMRTDEGIWVSASVEMSVRATCSRCLAGFSYPMKLVVEEEYVPSVDITTGRPLLPDDLQEDSFTIDLHHELDLTPALREYAITNLRMKPLCSESCPGLCPVCGADRSRGRCSCQEGGAAPRQGPLAEFLERGRQ
jgi:uncharacterized protein